ncbi:MAG: HAD-IA family hydrolase [Mariprofundaceae bacterium]
MPTAIAEADNAVALILFDCDGTLVDSHATIIQAMQRAFTGQGLTAPAEADVAAIIGLSLVDAVASLAPPESLRPAIVQDFCRHYTSAEQQLRLYPGVVETLRDLRQRGYWLGIVTGKSRSGLIRALEFFGIADLFYVLRTADCCPSKPHPAMVLESMQELGVSADRTWVIGDAIVDMQMASSASVTGLGVSFGPPMHETLKSAGAQVVVDEFAALLAHFPPLPDAGATPTMPVRI